MPIILDGDVTVAPLVLPAVRVAPPAPTTFTVLPVAGPTGPQGPPGTNGTPGGSAFVYTRDEGDPAATWVIDHDLGRKVHVTVLDATDAVVYADITHGSLNQTTITFAGPMTGSAVLS